MHPEEHYFFAPFLRGKLQIHADITFLWWIIFLRPAEKPNLAVEVYRIAAKEGYRQQGCYQPLKNQKNVFG